MTISQLRYESFDDPEEQERRVARGKEFFDILWTPAGAEGARATIKKHHPDLCRYMLIETGSSALI